jgi:hypothetical protein
VGFSQFNHAARLTPAGAPDTTFGNAGVLKADFDAKSSEDSALAMAMTPDGNIIVGGSMGGDFALSRFK